MLGTGERVWCESPSFQVAVVVDTFADARLNDVQNLAEEMEDEIEHDRKALAKLFARNDKDGSGQLTLQEMIEGARQDPGFQSRLRVMDIDEHDLEQLFQMIDRDQSGTIEVAEFIGPLSRWAHDSKTAPRFIKYHMLQTMQMQEDLWELSVECFNQLNTKIEALAGRMAGEYPAAEGPPKSREMSFEGAAPSEEVMTHIGSLDSRASQGSHITETMMSMDVSGNVKAGNNSGVFFAGFGPKWTCPNFQQNDMGSFRDRPGGIGLKVGSSCLFHLLPFFLTFFFTYLPLAQTVPASRKATGFPGPAGWFRLRPEPLGQSGGDQRDGAARNARPAEGLTGPRPLGAQVHGAAISREVLSLGRFAGIGHEQAGRQIGDSKH